MLEIIPFDPFGDVAGLRAEMQRLARTRPPGGGVASAPWSPATDVVESGDAIVILVELPGVKDEDIAVSIDDGMLTVEGERRLEEDVRDDRYHRIERSYGGFRRTFRLPPGVREEDIHAASAYGVLRITVPRPRAGRPRQIPLGG